MMSAKGRKSLDIRPFTAADIQSLKLHVILALQRMASGNSVKTVSLELGYENTSSFVNMFRKTLGKPPVRYLAEHRLAR